MSAPVTTPDPVEQVLTQVKELKTTIETQGKELTALKEKASQPVYPSGIDPARLFYAVNGPIPKDSEGYSIMKAIAWAQKWITRDECKLEADTHDKLKDWYTRKGFAVYHQSGSILVPFSTKHMPPPETDAESKLVNETRMQIKAHQGKFDPDEAEWVNKKLSGHFTKALGTIADSAGGVLVGFPTLGELIELQRNMEVFPKAGASEIALPANGRIQFPKLTGGSIAYAVGEAAAITESTQATGYLDLVGKKYAVLTKLNNELLRFASPTTEGLVRMDMSRQAALKMDLDMLEGTGGTAIKGLLTYNGQTAWSQGNDKLITYTVTSNTFQPNDPADMEANMADEVGEPTAWLMRRNMWAKIRNRRWDTITTGDAKGGFVFNLGREAREGIPLELEGVPVVRSSQISNTRGTGAQTYVVLGYFPDWVIARFGIMEFLATGLGDTPFVNDQTWLRAIQTCDAGARHASSFVFADAITIQ